jgi:hypothetical protein
VQYLGGPSGPCRVRLHVLEFGDRAPPGGCGNPDPIPNEAWLETMLRAALQQQPVGPKRWHQVLTVDHLNASTRRRRGARRALHTGPSPHHQFELNRSHAAPASAVQAGERHGVIRRSPRSQDCHDGRSLATNPDCKVPRPHAENRLLMKVNNRSALSAVSRPMSDR